MRSAFGWPRSDMFLWEEYEKVLNSLRLCEMTINKTQLCSYIRNWVQQSVVTALFRCKALFTYTNITVFVKADRNSQISNQQKQNSTLATVPTQTWRPSNVCLPQLKDTADMFKERIQAKCLLPPWSETSGRINAENLENAVFLSCSAASLGGWWSSSDAAQYPRRKPKNWLLWRWYYIYLQYQSTEVGRQIPAQHHDKQSYGKWGILYLGNRWRRY